MIRVVRALLLAAVAASLFPIDTPAAEFYRLGPDNHAFGVSADGSVVVTNSHVWTLAGGFIEFAPGETTYPRAISNKSIVVGLTDGDYLAFRTPVGGPLERLNQLPGATYGSDAFDISADGSTIVGYSSSATGSQAFRWTSATGTVGLGHLVPGMDHSDSAFGVSADGAIVVGSAEGPQGPEAFRWTAATGMVGLGDLAGGAFNSTAQAISGDGQVIVGHSQSAAGQEAFRWTQATGMIGLGDLPGDDFTSKANAANFDGSIIVGESRPTLTESDAFIWTSSGGMRNLQEMLITDFGLGAQLAGWRLWEASDISDDGRVIVGHGRGPTGELEGFVAVIPEPSTIALAGVVLLVLLLHVLALPHRVHRTRYFRDACKNAQMCGIPSARPPDTKPANPHPHHDTSSPPIGPWKIALLSCSNRAGVLSEANARPSTKRT